MSCRPFFALFPRYVETNMPMVISTSVDHQFLNGPRSQVLIYVYIKPYPALRLNDPPNFYDIPAIIPFPNTELNPIVHAIDSSLVAPYAYTLLVSVPSHK